jgi:hypothetical protein
VAGAHTGGGGGARGALAARPFVALQTAAGACGAIANALK